MSKGIHSLFRLLLIISLPFYAYAKSGSAPVKKVAVLEPGQSPVPEVCLFSLQGKKLIPCIGIKKDGRIELSVGGEYIGTYDKIEPRFFDDTRLNWALFADNRYIISSDGKMFGSCTFTGDLVFKETSTGYRWMIIGYIGMGGHFLITDKGEYGPYDRIFSPCFNASGTKWRCIVRIGNIEYFLSDGKLITLKIDDPSGLYQPEDPPRAFYSPEWNRWGYVLKTAGGDKIIFDDGAAFGPYPWVTLPVYSLSGKHWAFAYQKNDGWQVVTDGADGQSLTSEIPPVLSYIPVTPKKELLTVIAQDKYKYMNIAGTTFGPYQSIEKTTVQSGQWCVSVLTPKKNTAHIINGKEYGPYVLTGVPSFSAKSWGFPVHAPNGKEYLYFADGKQSGSYKKIDTFRYFEGSEKWMMIAEHWDTKDYLEFSSGKVWGPYESFGHIGMNVKSGDTVYIADGKLYINGTETQKDILEFYMKPDGNKTKVIYLYRDGGGIYLKEISIK
ncbi:MAG: hypothetical protein HPY53_02110 [Brevinematales bacterium]|nr:hypothetical protein [Brevinematales bacterium]